MNKLQRKNYNLQKKRQQILTINNTKYLNNEQKLLLKLPVQRNLKLIFVVFGK